MPLYEYKCERCNAVFEVIQKFSDSPLETHEGCGGRVERLLSPAALQFKGTGWYVTDYAHKNGSSSTAGAKAEAASHGAGKNGSAKSETKTAPAATEKPKR